MYCIQFSSMIPKNRNENEGGEGDFMPDAVNRNISFKHLFDMMRLHKTRYCALMCIHEFIYIALASILFPSQKKNFLFLNMARSVAPSKFLKEISVGAAPPRPEK